MVETQAHWRYGRAIASWDDVDRIALSLPETETGTTFRTPAWKVAAKPKPKAFAWVRPLGKNDIKQLGELGREIPSGEILGLRTDGMAEKAAVLEQFSEFVFDIPHFSGYAGVLVKLDDVPLQLLEDLIVDAWLALAPREVVARYMAEHREVGD